MESRFGHKYGVKKGVPIFPHFVGNFRLKFAKKKAEHNAIKKLNSF